MALVTFGVVVQFGDFRAVWAVNGIMVRVGLGILEAVGAEPGCVVEVMDVRDSVVLSVMRGKEGRDAHDCITSRCTHMPPYMEPELSGCSRLPVEAV